MLDVITAIQAAIQASSTFSHVKDNDVYITEDIRLIRAGGSYPAIALKDNGTAYAIETASQQEDTMEVIACVYVQLFKQGQAIVGTPDGKPGVLQMAQDLVNFLNNNKLGGIVETAMPLRAGASEIVPQENRAIQLLPITIKYTREVTI